MSTLNFLKSAVEIDKVIVKYPYMSVMGYKVSSATENVGNPVN